MSGCHSTITAARQCWWCDCVLNMLLPSMHSFDSSLCCWTSKALFTVRPGNPPFLHLSKRSPAINGGKPSEITSNSRADIQEGRPYTKCMRVRATSSVQFPYHQPERLPGFGVLTFEIILKLFSKWGKKCMWR